MKKIIALIFALSFLIAIPIVQASSLSPPLDVEECIFDAPDFEGDVVILSVEPIESNWFYAMDATTNCNLLQNLTTEGLCENTLQYEQLLTKKETKKSRQTLDKIIGPGDILGSKIQLS